MVEARRQKLEKMQLESLKFLALGGEEDVTRNMYLYEFQDQILIVDCGLGFPDEPMLGVDLLLPDITYLLNACLPEGKATKKIVGMLLTHGHEDHIGGLPFILPQLPSFPLYGSPLTAALANDKLAEFKLQPVVQRIQFTDGVLVQGAWALDQDRTARVYLSTAGWRKIATDSDNIFYNLLSQLLLEREMKALLWHCPLQADSRLK